MVEKIQERVKDILSDFTGLKRARALFAELNYDLARDTLSRQNWGKAAAGALVEDPQIIATHGDFHVIYSRLAADKRFLGPERAVINTLLREHPYSLFLFSTENELLWHFVNSRLPDRGTNQDHKEASKRRLYRRITIRERETRLRTATERISMLDLEDLRRKHGSRIDPLPIQGAHDKAFDVEAVTKSFYDDYRERFDSIMSDFKRQTRDSQWSHDYSLQLLNRTMFLYFVQRKGWLGKDSEFFKRFWTAYQAASRKPDTFFSNWLTILFFDVFNQPASERRIDEKHLPDNIRSDLSGAPYLNGGLFDRNKLDRQKFKFRVTDDQFGEVFRLFENYNFTIAENSPLDQEVAVDPEMIGKVYETLVRVSETDSTSGELGVVYTPRTEIDLMCRLSLVDNLANHLGQEHKNLFYEAVFSLDQEYKESADKRLADSGLWPDVEKRLKEITVVDPACGSGAFLVGMLHVLDDLLERAERNRGEEGNDFERKKRIIGQSLYGVEVRDWACNVAELRLWLSLIVDAEFSIRQLLHSKTPLLPHLRFNVRCGDSLVQEVGGIDMGHWRSRGMTDLSRSIKHKLTELKNEKTRFYRNEQGRKFKTVDELKEQEVLVFKELLQDRIKTIDTEVKSLERQQQQLKVHRQMRLNGSTEGSEQLTLRREEIERQTEERTKEKGRIESVCNALSHSRIMKTVNGEKPELFVWDIGFAEIFSGDNRGFDIVVGNPPYIRQEKIADPRPPQAQITGDKKEYKAKLARSVYRKYPGFFGYEVAKDKASHEINKKSDLYVYFYFHSLSLLNDKGSFCFITSNTWLDVGYGTDLQEFLLNCCHVKLIVDNKAKRSFKEADVNTVIVLFSAPQQPHIVDVSSLEKTARFVMFDVSFEEVLHPVLFQEVEEAATKKTTKEYRVFPITQDKLLADGCESPEESEKKKSGGPLIKTAKYTGNKWGGKYLRAPDIYWTILEKGKGKLVRLGDIAEVRFGIKTGANEFFYLSEQKIREWGIESEFLKPVVKSPRECKTILINPDDLRFKIFMCHENKTDLRGTAALEYIKWGEQSRKDDNGKEVGQFNNRPSCRGRANWWDLGQRRYPPLICPSSVSELWRVFLNKTDVYADKRLYEIYPNIPIDWCHIAANSSLSTLFLELGSRTGLGEGLLDMTVYEVADCLVVGDGDCVSARDALQSLRTRERKTLADELNEDDRLTLDRPIFDILGLTHGEREAVYEAVIDLVKSRLKKAGSLNG